MRLPKFEYLTPKSLKEASGLRKKHGDKAMVIAGGTDLLVRMKNRQIVPEFVIGLAGIKGLDYIKYDDRLGLKIGALAKIEDIASAPVVKEKYPLLSESLHKIGSLQIRNIATLAGNLCNASPSADGAPSLICLGAKVKLVSQSGVRTVPLDEFFQGPGITVMQPGEILAEIQVPRPQPHSGGAYFKLSRTAVDLAVVGVAAFVRVEPRKKSCAEARVALGAVAPTPIRAKEAEAIVRGKVIQDSLIEEAAQLATGASCCISDIRGSADYRTEVVHVLTKRALKEAWERAKAAL